MINPGSALVDIGEVLQFSATTISGGTPISGSYSWAVASAAGSTIDANGHYKAGSATGTDRVTVTDTANGNITASATVEVTHITLIKLDNVRAPCEGSVSVPLSLKNIEGVQVVSLSSEVSFDSQQLEPIGCKIGPAGSAAARKWYVTAWNRACSGLAL